MTCKHLSRDRGGDFVCAALVGYLYCESCKTADTVNNFAAGDNCVWHAGCGKSIQPLVTDDWREGFIGKPVDGFMSPLPSCPGYVEETMPAEPPKSKARQVTKSLF
jgi:hypothetical protein